MGIERATVLYPINSTTVDTGTGIDIRLLSNAQPGADDDTGSCVANHTQDNVERTFDPATASVTNTNNAATTLFTLGYALRLREDSTPTSRLATDSSSNGVHGLVVGNVSLIAGETGFGSRVDFPGTDADDATQGIVATLSSASISAWTFETRFRKDVNTNETLAQWGAYIGGTLYGVLLTATTGNYGVQYYENDVLIAQVFGGGAISNAEHQIRAVWDGTTLYLYIDGTRIGTTAMSSFYSSAAFEVWLGRGAFDTTSPAAAAPRAFNGAADELRISNNARSTGASYAVDTAPFNSDANTLLLWHLDDISYACNAALTAGTLNVNMSVTLNQTGGTYVTGTYGPTWRASLWRYDPAANTGTLIGAGSATGTTWDYTPATGDLLTYKTVTAAIVLAAGVELLPGETVFLQHGLNTGTIPNPTVGTASWSYRLRIDTANTNITFAAGQGMHQTCALSGSTVGAGVGTRGANLVTMARSGVGAGVVTATRVSRASKSASIVGAGVVTQSHVTVAAKSFSLVGAGVVTQSHATIAAKSFSLVGAGVVAASRVVIASKSASVVGAGVVTASKASIASKSFNVVGAGVITETHPVQAFRTFNVVGAGVVTGRIEIPIDEVPEGGGGGTTVIRRITNIFDD